MKINADAAMKRLLRQHPDARIRYNDAIAPGSHFLRVGAHGSVLYLNPQHRSLVEEHRNAT